MRSGAVGREEGADDGTILRLLWIGSNGILSNGGGKRDYVRPNDAMMIIAITTNVSKRRRLMDLSKRGSNHRHNICPVSK